MEDEFAKPELQPIVQGEDTVSTYKTIMKLRTRDFFFIKVNAAVTALSL